MKKIMIFLTFALMLAVSACAQTQNDEKSNITNSDNTPAYQLFPTKNMWTFIKLNTRTGQMWQVQYSVEGAEYRFETYLNEIPLLAEEKKRVNGRFTLYETQNNYNFILLDQIDGDTWQVQWSMEADQRAVIPIR